MTATEFRRIMDSAGRRMFMAAFSVCGSTDDARDAVQDAMCRLWEHPRGLDNADSPEAYAVMTARNCAADLRKRNRLTLELQESDSVSAAADPLESTDRLAHVIRLIDALPGLQRRVITMRDLEGMEMEEIERTLNLTATNARVILSRARNAIRRHFII